MSKKKILAIILARSGSKGLRNKNLKMFFGKPLICHTFETVKKTKIFEKIILSTDSKMCIKLAKKYKIEAPFIRPKKLSSDKSSALDVIQHALEFVLKKYGEYDLVQYVMPTTPLKNVEDFKNGLKLFRLKSADMIVSVCKSSKPKEWLNPISKDLSLQSWVKFNIAKKNRQKFKQVYYFNGCIYLAKWNIFYKKKNWFKQKIYALEMPRERSIDIDDIDDFNLAKYHFKSIKKL